MRIGAHQPRSIDTEPESDRSLSTTGGWRVAEVSR